MPASNELCRASLGLSYPQALSLALSAVLCCALWLWAAGARLRLPPGAARAVAVLPVLAVNLFLPKLFCRWDDTVTIILVSFNFYWLSSFKAISWALNRGALCSQQFSPSQFVAVYATPISPVPAAPAAAEGAGDSAGGSLPGADAAAAAPAAVAALVREGPEAEVCGTSKAAVGAPAEAGSTSSRSSSMEARSSKMHQLPLPPQQQQQQQQPGHDDKLVPGQQEQWQKDKQRQQQDRQQDGAGQAEGEKQQQQAQQQVQQAQQQQQPERRGGRLDEDAGGWWVMAGAWVGKCLFIGLLIWLLAHPLPNMVRAFTYSLALYALLSLIMDGPAAVVIGLTGLRVSPHFDRPWRSTAVASFWSKRWDLAAGNTLRQLVFDCVCEGRLLAPPQGTPRRRPSSVHQLLASSATFAVSGLAHEGIFWYLTGHTTGGVWLSFFMAQVPLMVFERLVLAALKRRDIWLPDWLRASATMHLLVPVSYYLFWRPCDQHGVTQSAVGNVRAAMLGALSAARALT